MMWKGSGPPEPREGFEGLDSVFRQVEQASELADQVVEVHQAQAAGVALRESLVSLAGVLADSVPPDLAKSCGLKRGDFVGWSELAAQQLAPGERLKRRRVYMTTVASAGWRYVSWLAHDRHGTAEEAQEAASIVEHVVMQLASLLLSKNDGLPEECPRCSSRKVASDENYFSDGYDHTRVCETCGWRSETTWTEYPRRAGTDPGDGTPRGDCTPSSDGPGK